MFEFNYELSKFLPRKLFAVISGNEFAFKGNKMSALKNFKGNRASTLKERLYCKVLYTSMYKFQCIRKDVHDRHS